MDKVEEFDILVQLERRYLIMATGKEDFDERDKFSLYKTLFPDWWFYSSDYDLQIKLLSRALNENKKLYEIDDVHAINHNKNMRKLVNNIEKGV